jgi:hypothetical protein
LHNIPETKNYKNQIGRGTGLIRRAVQGSPWYQGRGRVEHGINKQIYVNQIVVNVVVRCVGSRVFAIWHVFNSFDFVSWQLHAANCSKKRTKVVKMINTSKVKKKKKKTEFY